MPFASAGHLAFDSGALPPGERFDHYRALYGASVDATATGAHFHAVVRGWRLDRALVYDRHLNHVAHRRDAARAERDEFDHVTLTIVRSGRFEVDSGAGYVIVHPGQAVLIDMRLPVANRADNAHLLTISLARDRLAAAAGGGDALHGLVLDAQQAALLIDFALSLVSRIDMLNAESSVPIADALAALLLVALGTGGDGDMSGGGTKSARLAQLRRLIDRSLADHTFGAADVIAQSGLSRATLYRLLQDDGGLASFIQHRRLEKVRTMLSDPAETRPFAQIADAAGFTSDAHCSRLFHEQFRTRPSEYRAAILQPSEEPDASPPGDEGPNAVG